MRVLSIFLIAVACLLSGCANLRTQSRDFVTNESKAITVDASQRAIFSVKKTYKNAAWDAICAEPSPDALVAVATTLGIEASVATKALGITSATQESAAAIGLRTQTIQILRDAMYRICEGYASGALNNVGFLRLQRRYQHIMLGLLAIEQLTGPVVAQQLAISSVASVSKGKEIAALAKEVGDAAAGLAKVEAQIKVFQTTISQLTKTQSEFTTTTLIAEKEALETQLKKTSKDLVDAKIDLAGKNKAYETIAEIFDASKGTSLAASGSISNFSPLAASLAIGSSATYASMAQTVQTITLSLINKDYNEEACFDAFVSGDRDADDLRASELEVMGLLCASKIKDESQRLAFLKAVNVLIEEMKKNNASKSRKVTESSSKSDADQNSQQPKIIQPTNEPMKKEIKG